MKIVRFAALLCSCLLISAAHGAEGQRYPHAPVTLVVPYPAGGTVDTVARALAEAIRAKTTQTVVVENKPGAGTLIAAGSVARAKPDGLTLFVAPNTTLTVAPSLFKKMPYASNQLDPIGLIGYSQLAFVVNAKSGYTKLSQVVDASKKAPLSLTYGSFGNGTITHLAGEYFNQISGAKVLHVPYKGASPAMTDLLGNSITMMIDALPSAIAQAKNGSVRILAVGGRERSQQLPEVPTVSELGWNGYNVEGWVALVAPANVPADTRAAIANLLKSVLAESSFQTKLKTLGLEPPVAQPQSLESLIAEETRRYRQVIMQANITIE